MPGQQYNLEPLTYHVDLRDYLKAEEPDLWKWFASAQAKADYSEQLRLELLKSTYRLDPEGHPDIHRALGEAKMALGLDIPVTLYQAQNSPQLNASLYYIPGQGHIVFSGPVFNLLDSNELKSVIGHELAHYLLWQREGGEFHVADRLVHAVAQDPRAASSHEQTARRYQLYTEIFADRGALAVLGGEAAPVIASLVKMETGMAQVSADSYLKQAEEIFAKGPVTTQGVSHPEAFIRARALSLWQQQNPETAALVEAMIQGTDSLDTLDLVGQRRFTAATRLLIERLLSQKWFQTPATLGHARLFFDDFQPVNGDGAMLRDTLKLADARLREYLCYVLLDFAKADPELDDMPLAAALHLSRELELDAQFEKLAARELKMKVREVRRIKEQAAELLAKAGGNGD